jgi:hypothetical protein
MVYFNFKCFLNNKISKKFCNFFFPNKNVRNNKKSLGSCLYHLKILEPPKKGGALKPGLWGGVTYPGTQVMLIIGCVRTTIYDHIFNLIK